MSAAALRARLAAEGLMAQAWHNGPLDHYPKHRHGYDKVVVAAAGAITFHLPELGRDVLLAAGDRLHLPAGTLHGADVGRAGVTCLEAHLDAGTLGPGPELQAGWGATDRPAGADQAGADPAVRHADPAVHRP